MAETSSSDRQAGPKMAPKSRLWIAAAIAIAAGLSIVPALAQGRGAGGAQGRGAGAGRGAVAAPAARVAGIPRMPDGKPDLSGFWQAMTSAAFDIEPHSAQPGVPAGLGIIEGDQLPYLP